MLSEVAVHWICYDFAFVFISTQLLRVTEYLGMLLTLNNFVIARKTVSEYWEDCLTPNIQRRFLTQLQNYLPCAESELLPQKRTIYEFSRSISFGWISLDRDCVITQTLRNEVEVDKNVLDMKLLWVPSSKNFKR